MIDTTSTQIPVQVHVCVVEDDRSIQARIEAEYREMPGLSLTLSQASRLFNLEPASCARALDALVTDGALWNNGHAFVRTDMSRHWPKRLGRARMLL